MRCVYRRTDVFDVRSVALQCRRLASELVVTCAMIIAAICARQSDVMARVRYECICEEKVMFSDWTMFIGVSEHCIDFYYSIN